MLIRLDEDSSKEIPVNHSSLHVGQRDRVPQFYSPKLPLWNGIEHEITIPYESRMNDVVERADVR